MAIYKMNILCPVWGIFIILVSPTLRISFWPLVKLTFIDSILIFGNIITHCTAGPYFITFAANRLFFRCGASFVQHHFFTLMIFVGNVVSPLTSEELLGCDWRKEACSPQECSTQVGRGRGRDSRLTDTVNTAPRTLSQGRCCAASDSLCSLPGFSATLCAHWTINKRKDE